MSTHLCDTSPDFLIFLHTSHNINVSTEPIKGARFSPELMLTVDQYEQNMAEARHPSDGSIESDGAGRKEERDSNFMPGGSLDQTPSTQPIVTNPALLLDEVNYFEDTAYSWPTKKKWAVLTVVALCQTSMSKYKSQLTSNIRTDASQTTTRLYIPMPSNLSMRSTTLETISTLMPEPAWLTS
jgi:hypothetical protein